MRCSGEACGNEGCDGDDAEHGAFVLPLRVA